MAALDLDKDFCKWLCKRNSSKGAFILAMKNAHTLTLELVRYMAGERNSINCVEAICDLVISCIALAGYFGFDKIKAGLTVKLADLKDEYNERPDTK